MKLEQILLTEFQVTQIDLDKAKAYQQKFGGRIEKLLVNMGSLSEESLLGVYSSLLSLPVEQAQVETDAELGDWCKSLKLEWLSEKGWFPALKDNCFWSADPLDWEVNQYLLGANVVPSLKLASKADIQQLSQYHLQNLDQQQSKDTVLTDLEEDKLRELATEAPTVNLLNSLIAKGVKLGASDLHLEPVQGRYRIRYRVDGVLHDDGDIPSSLQLAVISRVKILSNMDIAEKRRPQDGKIEIKISNIDLDIRVSALPLNKGESVVMRFLRKDAVRYDMNVLGISDDLRTKIEQDLASTSGVILLTGPTGSGKTTSLYTFLHELNDEEVKIITLEDPVEYQLEGINQVQVNSEIGFDFAAGLRSIVRQDPDIIMVGEIRDQETARIAMQSALTGHLVFSTVHTNDAPSAFTRLVDLGVEEFLLDAAIVAVIAQRLVRKVCPHCAQSHEDTDTLTQRYELDELCRRFALEHRKVLQAKGCEACGGTGYKGRMSILEYMRCDDDIRNLNKDDYFIPEARRLNKEKGNRTLLEDGLLKACQGQTTIEEVLRVCA